MWNIERNNALNSYIARSARRLFEDGDIGGLQIQEYWHPDIPPSGSEQSILFFRGRLNAFASLDEFVLVARLFDNEDDVIESARFTFALDGLKPVSIDRFLREWSECCAKLKSPPNEIMSELISAVIVCDDWNERFLASRDAEWYYAIRWSTSA